MSSTPSQRPQVLIIEDDAASRVSLQMLLEHYDYNVSVAATMSEAVELLDSKPDYVLLDLMLPDGDGTRILQRIRSSNLSTRVAVMTASNDPERLERVRRLKPDLHFRKPLNFIELLAGLKQCA
jgi:DNA-binding response OmpR family regulator